MIEKDYCMRIVHEIGRTLIKLIFNIDQKPEEELEIVKSEEANLKYEELLKILREDGINHAEDKLYEMLESGDRSVVEAALYFYEHINSFDDEMLEQNGFSRDEIKEGLLNIAKVYGYDKVVKTFLFEEINI